MGRTYLWWGCDGRSDHPRSQAQTATSRGDRAASKAGQSLDGLTLFQRLFVTLELWRRLWEYFLPARLRRTSACDPRNDLRHGARCLVRSDSAVFDLRHLHRGLFESCSGSAGRQAQHVVAIN